MLRNANAVRLTASLITLQLLASCSSRVSIEAAENICALAGAGPTLFVDQQQSFVIALPAGVTAVSSPGGSTPAALLEHQELSGLATSLTRQSASPLAALEELLDVFSHELAKRQLGKMTVRTTGTLTKETNGIQTIRNVVWAIESTAPTHHRDLRSLLLDAALRSASVPKFIADSPDLSTSHLVKLSLLQQGQNLRLIAIVVPKERYESSASSAAWIADDLGNGTAVAPFGHQLISECNKAAIDRMPKADIIWVVDESESMTDNRKDIVDNANRLFSMAQSAGLDFRMGVTGVRRSSSGAVMGKFCSRASGSLADDGGADRFLGPADKALFSACIENPPYYEEDTEEGLTNAYWAVRNHLPRADDDPTKIRRDARLAIIFVTDEIANELKVGSQLLDQPGFFADNGTPNYQCTAEPSQGVLLSQSIAPVVELLSGRADPEAEALVQVIGGTCSNSCQAEVAHGYKDLAEQLGGQVGDVCQADLSATLQLMLDSIAASAAPHLLDYRPVSSTLKIVYDGQRLARAHPVSRSGKEPAFLYDAANNAITLVNVKYRLGDQLIAAYERFIPQAELDGLLAAHR